MLRVQVPSSRASLSRLFRRNLWIAVGRPHHRFTRDPHQVPQVPRVQPSAKFGDLAVPCISEHDMATHAPAKSVVYLLQCDLPFPEERDLLGDLRPFSPLAIRTPRLGQVQAQTDARAALLASEVQAR